MSIAMLLSSCSTASTTAGVNSETTNRIISSVAVSSNGNAIVEAKVYIQDYKALLDIDETVKLATVTDDNGYFKIEKDDHPLDKNSSSHMSVSIEVVGNNGNRT